VIGTVLVLPVPLALLAPEAERIVVLAGPVGEANVARGVTEPLGGQ